jgi:hypothetical protein
MDDLDDIYTASEYNKDFPLIPGRYDINCIDALASSIPYSIW